MHRFFIPKENFKQGIVAIGASQSHHIIDVMRLEAGDKLLLFDGTGKEYECCVDNIKNKIVSAKVIKELGAKLTDSPIASLAVAVPKNNFEFIIQKATELGVHQIIPIKTKRTIVKFNSDKFENKNKRWQKIAALACEQSGRAVLPIIRQQLPFDQVLDEIKKYDLALIPTLCLPTSTIKEALKGFAGQKVLLLIGPEGDFTEDEVEAAVSKGACAVTLGRGVLKVDTACIASLAIIMHELNK